jgi:hypothetical protein
MKYLLMALLLTGCDSPEVMQSTWEQKDIENLKFYKGKHDICYAIRRLGGTSMMTTVPCEKVGL